MDMEEKQQLKFREMTETPVEKLVCKMALPTVISMLVSSFYNMVDTFYVGHLSTSATAAVGIVFSYMALIQAVSFLFGHGSGNFISRQLGQKNVKAASEMAATGFFSALITGFLLLAAGTAFINPIVRMLGATDTSFAETKIYLQLILLGTPYIMASFVLNNQMRLQGNAFFAMIGISAGAVLNIALDPLFIFVFHLGVAGAALATVLAQLVSFAILLANTGKNGGLVIKWRNFSPCIPYFTEILAGGLPSLCRQGIASVAAMYVNRAAGVYSDSAIAAMSVVSRITMFSGSALLGFGQGFQPVCGFNYGAGLYDRVKKAFWFCAKASIVGMTAIGVIAALFAPQIIALFRADDALLLEIGTRALRWQSIVFPFLGFIILTSMYLQNIRKTVSASILALARQGLFFLPLIWILPNLFGLTGILLAQPLSDFLTFALALPMGGAALKKMGKV